MSFLASYFLFGSKTLAWDGDSTDVICSLLAISLYCVARWSLFAPANSALSSLFFNSGSPLFRNLRLYGILSSLLVFPKSRLIWSQVILGDECPPRIRYRRIRSSAKLRRYSLCRELGTGACYKGRGLFRTLKRWVFVRLPMRGW